MIRNLRIAATELVLSALFGSLPAVAAPDPGDAAQLFAEAKAICARDAGRLWGQSLCGPILLVDYTDRKVIANQPDGQGRLVRDGDQFEGILPEDVIIANTPTEWSGTRWTQLIAPITPEPMNRHVTLAYELFHRIQPGLGLSRPEAGNRHLDTFDGRYLLQLEWRAGAGAGRNHAWGAARGRHWCAGVPARARPPVPGRRGRGGGAGDQRGHPRIHRRRAGSGDGAGAHRLRHLRPVRFVRPPTFVRSFAYATGPAYGLLLDRLAPGWRAGLREGRRLDELLATAVDFHAVASGEIAVRERRYDEDGLPRASESRRERERQAMLVDYQARLVDGPVLSLPGLNANYQFNPQSLIPLGGAGTIYPKLGLTDDWGAFELNDGGALVREKSGSATVPARGIAANHLSGPGWRLSLKPGWAVRPGARTGDFEVAHAFPSTDAPRPAAAAPK